MPFNKCLLLACVVLVSACAIKPSKQSNDEGLTENAAPVVDHSDYARLGLVTIDSEQRLEFKNALKAIKSKNQNKADAILDGLIAQRPDLEMPIYNKALLVNKQGDTEKALSLLSQAHEIDPSDYRICNAYGRLLRSEGKFAEAKKVYSVCLTFEDQSAVVHKNYGILLDLYLHQHELALKHYQTYLSMTGNKDKKVKGWVLDLNRRLKAGGAQ